MHYQILEDMLHAYCMHEQTKWTRYLYLVEFAYNSSFHKTIGMSPLKALYGQECLTQLKWADPLIQVQASKEMLEEMETQIQLIRQDIKVAQDRQKSYAKELCKSTQATPHIQTRCYGFP